MTEQIDEHRRVERAMDGVMEDHDEPLAPDPHPDRTRTFSAMGFARMRTRWNREERDVIDTAMAQAETDLMEHFADIYRILGKLYEIVREPQIDQQTGEILKDLRGLTIWRTDEWGGVVEDWSKLTERDKENFLYQITTRLVMWEQEAARLKGEALFAKALWEERFADAFTSAPQVDSKRPTEADRTQHAQYEARDRRYMAIYMTVRSNKADALVRGTERLAQRFKDMLG